MIVAGQCFRKTTPSHYRERHAVGQAPLLVSVLFIQLRSSLVKILGKGDDLHAGIVLDRSKQRDSRRTMPCPGERVADLEHDRAGGDETKPLALDPPSLLNGCGVVLIS